MSAPDLGKTINIPSEHLHLHSSVAKALTDHISAALVMTDAKGRCVYMNPAAEKMFGYSFDELKGKRMHDMVHYLHADGTPYPQQECPLSQALENDDYLENYEELFIRKDRSFLPVRCTAKSIKEHDTLTAYVFEFHDISEEKRTQSALEESERRFEQIVNDSSLMVVLWDKNAQITFVSKPLLQFTGLKPEYILKTGWNEQIHPDDRERVLESRREAFTQQKEFITEYRIRHCAGNYRWVYAASGPRISDKGDFLGYYTSLVDIEKQKCAQSALQKSEDRFRRLVDSNVIGVVIWKKDGSVADANDAYLNTIGYTRDDLLAGRVNWLNITPSEFHEDELHRLQEGEQLGYCEPYEKQYVRKDGIRVDVWVAVAIPMEGSEGGIALVQDITQRKKAEKALQEMQHLSDSGVIGILYSSYYGALYDANEAACKILGYSREEIQNGQVFWDRLTPTEYLEMDMEHIRESMERGICTPYEKQFIRKDKSKIDVLIGYSQLPDAKDKAICFVLDITARKQAERLIQESEHRFRIMADAAPVIIWLSDGEGNCTYYNKQWLNFTGKSLGENSAPFTWQDVIHPDDITAIKEVGQELQSNPEEFRMELRLYNAQDQDYRWVFSTGVPRFTSDGAFQGYVGCCMDIHNYKLAQEEIKTYARKLEQSNKDLEQFATIASHDLQAPLRKISLFSSFVAQNEAARLSPEGQDYFQRIQVATNKMQRLLTDLLDLSRVNRKGQPFRKVDLNDVMQEILSDLDYALLETHGEVQTENLCVLDADVSQMRQLLLNLIGNALKFHKPDVPPVVKVYEENSTPSVCRIIVSDNGIGFIEEDAERIFDPFVRLNGVEHYEGTGMGLTICRKIVERHEGNISARSKLGEGTQFIITLPKTHP